MCPLLNIIFNILIYNALIEKCQSKDFDWQNFIRIDRQKYNLLATHLIFSGLTDFSNSRSWQGLWHVHKVWNEIISLSKASVRHTLQPLCDLSATKIQNDRRGRRGVATRFCSCSATDRGLVADWSATSWGPLCDLMQLVADRSGTGPRLVADQPPISRRPSQLKTVIKKKNIDNIFKGRWVKYGPYSIFY